MHPDPRFRADPADLVERAAAIGFAHVFAATPQGPMVVHAPVTRHGDRLRFHVARANRIARHLDGADLLLSVAGPQGYVSPNWYECPGGQVPTWNFVTIEIEGRAAMLPEAGLIEQLDALARAHEPRPAPWTRDTMDRVAFDRLLRAIVGFELAVAAARGTTKLSQNKTPADRDGVIAGLHAAGNGALAKAMAAAAVSG